MRSGFNFETFQIDLPTCSNTTKPVSYHSGSIKCISIVVMLLFCNYLEAFVHLCGFLTYIYRFEGEEASKSPIGWCRQGVSGFPAVQECSCCFLRPRSPGSSQQHPQHYLRNSNQKVGDESGYFSCGDMGKLALFEKF